MKIALISDIHSNFFYLQESIKQIEYDKVDRIYCLGDIVGYYDQPNEVIDLIKNKNVICVKGNHEKYLLDEIAYNYNNEDIYRIKEHKKIINNHNLDFLSKLPESLSLKLNNRTFYITHSLPQNSLKYIYSLQDLDRDFLSNFDYYCFGHTHIPIVSYYYGTCIVNPGSIGQPRDYTINPSYIIIDIDRDSVELKKVPIDNLKYIKKLENCNYNQKLLQILNREK